MTEPDRIKQLETHLGLLSSRFDALEGRTSAVETQMDVVISSIQEINSRVALLVKNLNKTISIVESHAGITENINDNMSTLTDSVTMVVVLNKIRDGEDPDAVIAALPDEKVKQMVRRRIAGRRKQ